MVSGSVENVPEYILIEENKMEKELKAAILGLIDGGYEFSNLYTELVDRLISLYTLDDNTEAVTFWNSKL